MALAWKAGWVNSPQGFESPILRHPHQPGRQVALAELGPNPRGHSRHAVQPGGVRTRRAVAVDTGVVTHTEADAAYDARAWRRAFELYDGAPELDARDLDRFAVCAMLVGRMDDYFAVRERAYRQMLEAGDHVEAARAALWIGTQKMVQGDFGAGG